VDIFFETRCIVILYWRETAVLSFCENEKKQSERVASVANKLLRAYMYLIFDK